MATSFERRRRERIPDASLLSITLTRNHHAKSQEQYRPAFKEWNRNDNQPLRIIDSLASRRETTMKLRLLALFVLPLFGSAAAYGQG